MGFQAPYCLPYIIPNFPEACNPICGPHNPSAAPEPLQSILEDPRATQTLNKANRRRVWRANEQTPSYMTRRRPEASSTSISYIYEPRGVSLNDEKSLVPAYFLPCHPCLFAIVLCILRRMALPSLSLDGLRNGTVSIRLAATQCFLQYQNRTCSANTPVVRPKTTLWGLWDLSVIDQEDRIVTLSSRYYGCVDSVHPFTSLVSFLGVARSISPVCCLPARTSPSGAARTPDLVDWRMRRVVVRRGGRQNS